MSNFSMIVRDFISPFVDDSRLSGFSCQFPGARFCPSSSSLRLSSSFPNFLDVHRSVALTGEQNYRVAWIPVFSAFNIAKWHELLQHYPDNVICDFLEFGWPIGYMSDTLPIFDLRTHRGALTFPDQVNTYLSKEVQLGRIAGPFDKAPFMQGFVLSPLNTMEKQQDSEERRVVVDLIWPSGHSVNDGIPSDSYLGAPLSLRYPTIEDIVDAVVTFRCTKTIQFGERLLHIPLLSIPGSSLGPVSAYRRVIELIPAYRSCPVFLLPGPSGVVPLTKRSFVSQFRTCLSHIGIPHADR